MPTTPMLIGFTGHANAGKDTCAAVLAALGWRTIAFADALRIEICAAFGVDLRLLTERSTKELPLKALSIGMCRDAAFVHYAAVQGFSLLQARSPRWLMQHWGTEFRRASQADYWVRHVEHWIHDQLRIGHHQLAITDVRMPNEAAMLQRLGGHLVRVHRPGDPVALPNPHASEQHEALATSADIHNDADLPNLAAEVARVVRLLYPED